jgi:hypothetical protein
MVYAMKKSGLQMRRFCRGFSIGALKDLLVIVQEIDSLAFICTEKLKEINQRKR